MNREYGDEDVSQEIVEALYGDNRTGDSIVFSAKDGIFDRQGSLEEYNSLSEVFTPMMLRALEKDPPSHLVVIE